MSDRHSREFDARGLISKHKKNNPGIKSFKVGKKVSALSELVTVREKQMKLFHLAALYFSRRCDP